MVGNIKKAYYLHSKVWQRRNMIYPKNNKISILENLC